MIKKWFINRLKTIMADNEIKDEEMFVEGAEKNGHWTPTDLILREEYNNGGGSAKGFLGISTAECHKCYHYIKENQEELKKLGYYSEVGINNWGITLWTNWNVH